MNDKHNVLAVNTEQTSTIATRCGVVLNTTVNWTNLTSRLCFSLRGSTIATLELLRFRLDARTGQRIILTIGWYLGKDVCPSSGTSQSLPCWQTHTFQHLHHQLAPQLRWRRPGNKPSTPHCQGRACSRRLLWKLWAQRIGCAVLKRFGPQNHFCLCRWQGGAIPLPTTLCRSAEVQFYLVARVVWEWRRPGPLADQLFNLLSF